MLSTTEETLRHEFSCFKPGAVERVKKLTDYGFIHYRCREDAITALHLMNGAVIDGAIVEVTLAKPAGIKDGSISGRKHGSRGNNAGGGGGGGKGAMVGGVGGGYGDGTFLLQRDDGRNGGGAMQEYPSLSSLALPPRLGSPFYLGAEGGEEEV